MRILVWMIFLSFFSFSAFAKLVLEVKTYDQYTVANCGEYKLSKLTSIPMCLDQIAVKNGPDYGYEIYQPRKVFADPSDAYVFGYAKDNILVASLALFDILNNDLLQTGKTTELGIINLKDGEFKSLWKGKIGAGIQSCFQTFLLEDFAVAFCANIEMIDHQGKQQLEWTSLASIAVDLRTGWSNVNLNLLPANLFPTFRKVGDTLISDRPTENLGGGLSTIPEGRFDVIRNVFVRK